MTNTGSSRISWHPSRLIAAASLFLIFISSSARAVPNYWDPDFGTLGIVYEEAAVSAGTRYWKLIEAYADDPTEGGGKINIFYQTRDTSGTLIGSVWVRTQWNTGNTDTQTKPPPDWGDFPQTGGNWCPSNPPGPYTTFVRGRDNGNPDPSDRVVGMGLPCNQHWSYRLIFQETFASGSVPTQTPTNTAGPSPTPTPTSPGPPSTPVVNNPSFEFALTGNWTIWTSTGSNSDPLERDFASTGLPDGVWALAVKGIGSGGKGAYQYIPSGWVFGRIYRLTVQARNLTNLNMNYSIGWLQGNSGSAGAPGAVYGTAIVHPAGWTQASVQFTYTGSTGVTIYLRAVNDGHAERAGFDIVQITDLGPSGPTATPTSTSLPGATSTPTRTPTLGPTSTATPTGQPRWLLTYGREYGEFMTGGVAGQADLFATNEDGTFAAAGITNDSNPTTAIFGSTNPGSNPFTPGNLRVIFDPGNSRYDFHVYDPAVASDRSADCWWVSGLPHHGHYRFEFHWRKVANNAGVVVFPYAPVYYYDNVSTFNTQTTEAANWSSDAYSLSSWESFHGQTFVVPAGVNRIIECKAFAVRQGGEKFRMIASIRQTSPSGPQIGPAVTSREVVSNEYPNVLMVWGLNDIPVTAGGTYALRIESVDGLGFNMYATNNNNYPSGNLYNANTSVAGRDMVALVVGAAVNAGPAATATPSPTRTSTPTGPLATATPSRTPTRTPSPFPTQSGVNQDSWGGYR